MKKIISLICAALLVLGSILCLCSCGRHDGQQAAKTVVLGVHGNFPGIGDNAQALYESVYDTCLNYGEVSYVVVEGYPEQTKTFLIQKSDKSLSSTKEKELAKRNATGLLQGFSTLKAKTPEVDTLSSIALAANTLSASALDKRQMLVYDSGLCTAGLLSQLASNVLDTDAAIVADKLESLHALPDLKGVEVYWVGLGCVCGEQQKIPDSYLYKLKALWTEIIERSGGTVTFDSSPVTGQQADDLPAVSIVDFPQDNLNLKTVDMEQLSVIPFKEDTVKFLSDRAEFADKDAAEKALNPVIRYLNTNADKSILIAGTTADDGSGDGKELSLQRSQAVMQVLVNNGVAASQIDCIGLGCSDNCFRVEDHNADGSLNETMAAQNRAIYIVLAGSATAKMLQGVSV